MKNDKLIQQTLAATILPKQKITKKHYKNFELKKHPNFIGQFLSTITEYFKNNEIVIKKKYDAQDNSFLFTLFSKGNILKAIKSLPSNETSAFSDIPIGKSQFIFTQKISLNRNECLINSKFPTTLKRVDSTPIFKKGMIMKKEAISTYALNLFKSV